MTIAVRDFTNGSDVLANARRVKGVFFPPRQIILTQVPTAPKEAVPKQCMAETPDDQLGSCGTSAESDASPRGNEFSGEVLTLRETVAALQLEVSALRAALGVLPAEEPEEAARRVSMAYIRSQVMQEFRISRVDLESARKTNAIVHPRNALMWLLRRHTKFSLPAIGRFLGDKHHTTIMHGCDRAEELMAEDPTYLAKIEAIQARIEEVEVSHD